MSFFVAFTAIPIVIKISESKKLFDIPCDRKIHTRSISSLGGIGIFAALIFSISVIIPFATAPWIQYFTAAAVIIFFLGLKDDLLLLSPMKKFTGQLIASCLLVYLGHFQITSMHGFMGIQELHPFISIGFTYLTILVVINAFNLIDGVDGLAGVLGLISTMFFGYIFLLENEMAFAALSFSMASALVAFLIFNITPAKIFMGDTGSLLLGLVNAVLVVHFINFETSEKSVLHFKAAPALGFAVLFIPLLDTLRVTLIRVYNGKSPFEPDQKHLHHLLLKRGYSHLKITSILAAASVLFILFALVAQPMGINFVILSLFAISFSVLGIAKWIAKVSKKSNASLESTDIIVQTLSAKVITPSGGIKDMELNN
jgi:UDP-N-acetylmuramyl pentapeptide phosphotransferase/UDP-N-acetylglucosamine-1-phosphate transferase